MDKNNCVSIVPYTPVRKKEKKLDKVFSSRKNLYFTMFFVFGLFVFIGFCLAREYGGESSKDGLFSEIAENKIFYFYELDKIKFLFLSTLALFISSFTIFAPAVAITFAAFLSVKAGLFLAFEDSFGQKLFLCFFLFTALLYLTEIIRAYDVSKYGIKQIFKPVNVLSISLKTFTFLLCIVLYAVTNG